VSHAGVGSSCRVQDEFYDLDENKFVVDWLASPSTALGVDRRRRLSPYGSCNTRLENQRPACGPAFSWKRG